MNDTPRDAEVELDQHGEAGRQLSALLSAALAAAQMSAQVTAQRSRERTRDADQQTRVAGQLTRDQQRQRERANIDAQRQLGRQQRAEQAVRHRQWSLRPTAQWLHDNPLSAAAAWASADAHRDNDPVAARHAAQWETVFTRGGIDLADVRADAPAALATSARHQATSSASVADRVEVTGEQAAAEVATAAVVSGAVDAAEHAAAAEAGDAQWTAYADGAPAAALGGRGVSTPPSHVLAVARATPDPAASAAQDVTRAAELVHAGGLDR